MSYAVGVLARLTLALASVALLAAPAWAQDASPSPAQIRQARDHFDRGTEHYEQGNYAEAEAEFRAAYQLTRHPDLLYNIYTAAERNGDLEVAADALERYLADGEMNDARREALELRRERLRLRLEREAMEQERASRETADREARLAEEQAGREAAEARARQEREERLVGIRSGHASSDALLITSVTSFIAAGVGLALFGTFAALSQSEDDAVGARCGASAPVPRICEASDVEDLRRWNLAADVSWVSAAGLGLVGAVLLLIGESTRPSDRADDVATVRPEIGLGAARVVVEGAL